MKCHEIENLLPRYTEDNLSAEEKLHVSRHLEACAHCRESHAVYAYLEESLEGLKVELPSPEIISRTVMHRVKSRRKQNRFSPASVWNFPVIANFLLIMSGIIIFTYREAISRIAPGIGEGFVGAVEYFAENLPRWIIRAAGGETWVLATVLILCALLMTLTGGLAVIKFALK